MSGELKPNPNSAGRWSEGELPPNVALGTGTLITGHLAFKRFHSEEPCALKVGANCTMDGVHFDLGKKGRVQVGDFCYFTNAVLLCELELRIGNYVVIGWNTTITDSDFHPISPAQRIADASRARRLAKAVRVPKSFGVR